MAIAPINPMTLPDESSYNPSSPDLLSLSATVTLLEAYETPLPPLGSKGAYSIGHAIVRLRLENRGLEPMMLGAGQILIQEIDSDQTLLSTNVESITLGGLQIVEQGFHLTRAEHFGVQGVLKAVYHYRVNDVPYQVESDVVALQTNAYH